MKADSSRTRSQASVRLRERKRLHDTAVLMSLVAVFAAVFVVWYFRVLEVPLREVAWGFLGFWLAYLAASHTTDRLQTPGGLLAAVQALQCAAVGYLLWLWHLLGGMRHPTFLMVLVLPVLICGLLMQRWQPYATALFSVIAVWCTALFEDASLRWYLSWAVPLIGDLPGLSSDLGSGSTVLPDVQTTPALTLTALMTFTLVQALAAFLTESLSGAVSRLQVPGLLQEGPTPQSEAIFEGGLRAVPIPAILVEAGTARVVGASESFLRQMVLDRSDLDGREIFDLMDFERPHEIRGLIDRRGGTLKACRYGVGGERRQARVSVETFEAGGARYATLVVLDQKDEDAERPGDTPSLPRAV